MILEYGSQSCTLSRFKWVAYKADDTKDEKSTGAAIEWWLAMTNKGGEGMVVEPNDFIVFGKEGLLQPAVKCRGRECLRIIYRAEYDMP